MEILIWDNALTSVSQARLMPRKAQKEREKKGCISRKEEEAAEVQYCCRTTKMAEQHTYPSFHPYSNCLFVRLGLMVLGSRHAGVVGCTLKVMEVSISLLFFGTRKFPFLLSDWRTKRLSTFPPTRSCSAEAAAAARVISSRHLSSVPFMLPKNNRTETAPVSHCSIVFNEVYSSSK